MFNLVSEIVPHGTLFGEDVVCAIAKTGAIPIGKIDDVTDAEMSLVRIGYYVLFLAGAGNVAAEIGAVVFVKCALVQHLAELLIADRGCGFLFRIHVFTSLVCYLRRACDRSKPHYRGLNPRHSALKYYCFVVADVITEISFIYYFVGYNIF